MSAYSKSLGGTPSPRISLITLLLAQTGIFQLSGNEDTRINSKMDNTRASDQTLSVSNGESIIARPGCPFS